MKKSLFALLLLLTSCGPMLSVFSKKVTAEKESIVTEPENQVYSYLGGGIILQNSRTFGFEFLQGDVGNRFWYYGDASLTTYTGNRSDYFQAKNIGPRLSFYGATLYPFSYKVKDIKKNLYANKGQEYLNGKIKVPSVNLWLAEAGIGRAFVDNYSEHLEETLAKKYPDITYYTFPDGMRDKLMFQQFSSYAYFGLRFVRHTHIKSTLTYKGETFNGNQIDAFEWTFGLKPLLFATTYDIPYEYIYYDTNGLYQPVTTFENTHNYEKRYLGYEMAVKYRTQLSSKLGYSTYLKIGIDPGYRTQYMTNFYMRFGMILSFTRNFRAPK